MTLRTSTLNRGGFLLSNTDFKQGYELGSDENNRFTLKHIVSENLMKGNVEREEITLLGCNENNDLLLHKSLLPQNNEVSVGTEDIRINKSYFEENRSKLFILDRINKTKQLSNRAALSDSASYLYVDSDTDKLIYESVSGKIELTESGGASSANDDSLEEPVESMDLTYWAISQNQEDIVTNFKLGVGIDDPNEMFALDGAISLKEQTGSQAFTGDKGFGKIYVGDSGDLHYLNGSGVDLNISEKMNAETENGDGEIHDLTPWSQTFDETKIFSWHSTSIGTDKSNGTLTVNGGIGIGEVDYSPTMSEEFGQIYAKKDGHLYYTSTGGKEAMLTKDSLGNEEEMFKPDLSPFSLTYNQDRALIFNNPNHYCDYEGNIVCKELTQVSDISLKKNILPLKEHECSSIVSKLNPTQYSWIDNDQDAVGLIAQEVKEIAPILVKENDDGKHSINYGALTTYLIGAIKDLQKEVEELKRS